MRCRFAQVVVFATACLLVSRQHVDARSTDSTVSCLDSAASDYKQPSVPEISIAEVTFSGSLQLLPSCLIAVCCPSAISTSRWSQEGPSTAGITDHKKVTIPAGTSVVLLLSGRLVGEASTERRVLSGKWRNRKNNDPPTLVVVQDLIIEGVKTIAAGTKAQWAPLGHAARLFNEPGEVGVSVDSVTSVSGDSVPLIGSYSTTGDAPCAMEGCFFVPLVFWLHGDPGHVDAGLLLNAAVARDVEVNGVFTTSPALAVSTLAVSRLHLYSTPTPVIHQPEGHSSQQWIGIRLDGSRVGSLAPAEYGCVKVTPGKHSLKVGRDEIALDVRPGVEQYVRVIPTSKGKDKIVEETAGYELDSANLFPGRLLGKLQVRCFVPLGEFEPK